MEFDRDFPRVCKILLLGDAGVGKSSLLLRFADDGYTKNYISTIGLDFKKKVLEIGGEKVNLEIWDSAGQERFRTITSNYYRGVNGIILVYDSTNQETFDNVKHWLEELSTHGCEDVCKLLVGNKCDLTRDQIVPPEMGRAFAVELNVPFVETSAKDSINVDSIFETMVKEIQKREQPFPSGNDGVDLGSEREKNKRFGCC